MHHALLSEDDSRERGSVYATYVCSEFFSLLRWTSSSYHLTIGSNRYSVTMLLKAYQSALLVRI